MTVENLDNKIHPFYIMQNDNSKIKNGLTVEGFIERFKNEKKIIEKQLKNFKPSIWQSIKGRGEKYYLDQKQDLDRKIEILNGIIEKRNTLKDKIDALSASSGEEKIEINNAINNHINEKILNNKNDKRKPGTIARGVNKLQKKEPRKASLKKNPSSIEKMINNLKTQKRSDYIC